MWRKVKAFLNIMWGSIVPQTHYYSKVIKVKISISLKYYFLLLTFITVCSLVIISIQFNQKNIAGLKACLNRSIQEIPSNFALDIQHGRLTTNQEKQLFFWLNCEDRFHLLAVVDERTNNFQIHSYRAQILLTSTDITFRYKNNTYTIPYKTYFPNIHVEKNNIIAYIDHAQQLIKMYLPFFFLSFVICGPFIIWSINLFNLIVSSIMVYVFYMFFHKKYRFSKIFQIACHASTLPLIVSLLFLLFPIRLFNTLLLYFALYFIFLLVAVYEAHYVNTSPHKRP